MDGFKILGEMSTNVLVGAVAGEQEGDLKAERLETVVVDGEATQRRIAGLVPLLEREQDLE